MGQLELCIPYNVYPVYVNWSVASTCSWLLKTIRYYLIVFSRWPEKYLTNCLLWYWADELVWSMLDFRCYNSFVFWHSRNIPDLHAGSTLHAPFFPRHLFFFKPKISIWADFFNTFRNVQIFLLFIFFWSSCIFEWH